MSIKSILFKGVITSSGIVNFDGKDAKWLLKKAKEDCRNQLSHNNAKVAKHAFMLDGDKLSAVLKISKDCIRQSLFKEDQPFHNPAIVHAKKVLIKLLSSVAGLLRGYMFADVGIKKKSAIYISDAVQISKNVSTIDIGTQNAPKVEKESAEDDAGLSLHFKESIGGNVDYEFEGALDLDELQFISLSQVYDRMAIDPNYMDIYLQNLETTLGSKPSGKAFYIKKTAVGGLPEEGVLLNSDQVKFLIGEFFKRFFNLEITRGACGRAWLKSLEVAPKQGGLENSGWRPVKNVDDIMAVVDSVHSFYDGYDEAEAVKLYEGLNAGRLEQGIAKKAKKDAKKKALPETETIPETGAQV